jgi:hypothetical protein
MFYLKPHVIDCHLFYSYIICTKSSCWWILIILNDDALNWHFCFQIGQQRDRILVLGDHNIVFPKSLTNILTNIMGQFEWCGIIA